MSIDRPPIATAADRRLGDVAADVAAASLAEPLDHQVQWVARKLARAEGVELVEAVRQLEHLWGHAAYRAAARGASPNLQADLLAHRDAARALAERLEHQAAAPVAAAAETTD